jgi:hypothetical protein
MFINVQNVCRGIFGKKKFKFTGRRPKAEETSKESSKLCLCDIAIIYQMHVLFNTADIINPNLTPHEPHTVQYTYCRTKSPAIYFSHKLNPRANYTDQATAACRRSDCQLLRIEGATWSA